MQVHFEVTDTFGGCPNYSWVKRGYIEVDQSATDLMVIHEVKRTLGWAGIRCNTEYMGDTIAIYPRDMLFVCFITYDCEDASE